MEKKKKIIIGIIAAILVIAITVGVILITGRKEKSSDKKDDTTSQSSKLNIEDPDEKDSSKEAELGEEIKDDGTGITPDETKAVISGNTTGEKAPTITKSQPAANKDAAAEPIINKGDSSGYVQDANPETGISWDGKSRIVYTYTDGTHGSEKKNGATYEVAPGLIRIYYAPDEKVWDGTCSHCGKVSGDGKNGTCVRWLMSDMDCPNCGTHVKQGQCHTCK